MGRAITRELKFEFEVSENVPTEKEWERWEKTHWRGTKENKIASAVCIRKGKSRLPVHPETHLDSWSFEPELPGCPYLSVGCSWLSSEMEVTLCTCHEFPANGLQVRRMLEMLAWHVHCPEFNSQEHPNENKMLSAIKG